jgi:hypothetical protein
MGQMRALVLLGLVAACSDHTAPSIRMLQYTPNAGFVFSDTMVNGTFLYSDPDQDISQWVYELSDPNAQLITRSPPNPVESVSQGITGTVNFMMPLTKDQATLTGIYHFTIWLVDLTALESNHLAGELRIAQPAPYGPGNP